MEENEDFKIKKDNLSILVRYAGEQLDKDKVTMLIQYKTKQNKDKLDEYKQRHRDWRDIAVNQFSTANNVLITLSTGLLVFCLKESHITHIHIAWHESVDWHVFWFLTASILLGKSILLGIGVLLSRLYDFRITRHLTLCRQRLYFPQGMKFSKCDYREFNSRKRFCNFLCTLFCKIPRITNGEIKAYKNKPDKDKQKDDELNKKFKALKRQSDMLGETSWNWTKLQVGLFVLSGIVYFFVWFFAKLQIG